MTDIGPESEFEAWLDAHWSEQLTLRQWWAALADAGWSFPSWPVECGGRGAPERVSRLVRSVLARRGVVGPPDGFAVTMLAPTLLRHGTVEQRQTLLPRIARGDLTACQLFSEPGAGSDLASLRTSARLEEGGWVVNGQKVWTSQAATSDIGMLLARTGSPTDKRGGITYLLLPMDQPGVDVRPLKQMNGQAEFNEVFLNSAVAPAAAVVGEVDAGWQVAQATLAAERSSGSRRGGTPPAGVRAGRLDQPVAQVARAAAEEEASAPRLYSRSGRAARRLAIAAGRWEDPLVRDRVVQLHILSEATRALSARMRQDAPPGVANVAKLAAAQLAREARDLDLDILGASALLSGPDAPVDGEVELMALSAHMVSIGGGTDQIQKNILAERILGLPRDPTEMR
ncbi:acyl-CoA dehydrogenase family protein [Pseudofrankia asymbiotica]|uniref:Acyl-CoA dehydrogenase n=1 Tax=Pseudofrankia asymbiotica TaxID=1834516 RepID=A0A1V2I5L3_9ACTN|nr:acyl-CoA dehydrogenase family protein [Pseudofrankia asymbiotica]ONH26427.1 hypothetical protein BL253_24920 [Pseudofrankia asymbiotica]